MYQALVIRPREGGKNGGRGREKPVGKYGGTRKFMSVILHGTSSCVPYGPTSIIRALSVPGSAFSAETCYIYGEKAYALVEKIVTHCSLISGTLKVT